MEHYFTNNESLRSELRIIEYKYQDSLFRFFSDNGVFSKNKIDYGSKLLVETILKNCKDDVNTILDIGCGYGFMGIVLARNFRCKITLGDVNKRAIHLAKMNLKENNIIGEAIEGNGYQNIQGKYDYIVSNPPIRAGKEVVLDILINAKKYLSETGVLWFVIRRDQGAKSIAKKLEEFYVLNVVEKEKGFYVINAKKKLT